MRRIRQLEILFCSCLITLIQAHLIEPRLSVSRWGRVIETKMKRQLAFLLLLLPGTVSCQSQSQCGEELFTVKERSSISLTGITPGNKLVFEYVCQTKNFPETIKTDRGKRESILFEADAGNHAFYFAGDQLKRATAKVTRTCLCQPVVWETLKGTIEGRQTAPGQWEVNIDVAAVNAEGREVMQLKSSGVYRL
jgi:hypothetical protein